MVVEVGYCEDIVMELVAGYGLRGSLVDNLCLLEPIQVFSVIS